jgi:hypothetical protein
MKHIVISLLIALGCLGKIYGQTSEENLNKYWKYRDKLRKDFLKVGFEAGNSIPMCARAIGFAYSGAPLNDEDLKPSRIWYQDANIYLGHYLAVLATEYKLLSNSIALSNDAGTLEILHEQFNATKKELYYAIGRTGKTTGHCIQICLMI